MFATWRFAISLAIAIALNFLALTLIRLPHFRPSQAHDRIRVRLQRAVTARPAVPAPTVARPQAQPETSKRAVPRAKPTAKARAHAHSRTLVHTRSRSQPLNLQRLQESVRKAVEAVTNGASKYRSLDSIPEIPENFRHVKKAPLLVLKHLSGSEGRLSYFHGHCYAAHVAPIGVPSVLNSPFFASLPREITCPWEKSSSDDKFTSHKFGATDNGPPLR